MSHDIYAYFEDHETPNLTEYSYLNNNPWITFSNPYVIQHLIDVGFKISNDLKNINNAIYFVSVREYVDFWTGNTNRNPNNILDIIPKNIISLAIKRRIIIVIDNNSEGMPLFYRNVDGFDEIHRAMKRLKLPKNSVIFINGNKKFNDEYNKWCIVNSQEPKITHVYFLTGFYYFKNKPIDILIKDAVVNKSCDFNSLNRSVRNHRVDHLYTIIKNSWHKNNLVSGDYYSKLDDVDISKIRSYILDVTQKKYLSLLQKNCPLNADGNWLIKNPDDSLQHIFNHEIYKNSLLSVVTETGFAEEGLFITEKTFKPIAAGHPFIILGQPFLLKELNKMGYKTDFAGIDQSYDEIVNPCERFEKFHKSLNAWINTPREIKLDYLKKSYADIEHNQQLFFSIDYEKESYYRLINTADKIFKDYKKIEKN
jgi:hypothetical protein